MKTRSILAKVCFIVVVFLLQYMLEVLLMGLLAKLGVSYMGLEVQGESYKEACIAILIYFLYPKLMFTSIPYFFFMFVCLRFMKSYTSFERKVVYANAGISIGLFLILWVAYSNGADFLANPLLGVSIAAVLLILVFRSKKHSLLNASEL